MLRGSSLLLLSLVLSAGLTWCAERRAPPAQTRCPISGQPVNGSYFADVEGFRILTAGERESQEVRRNPGQAFANLARNREAANPIVWVCPSMRNPVAPNYPFIQQSGKRIYYCCAPCAPRIKNNFAAAAVTMKQLADQYAAQQPGQ